ncbi:Hypothetical predicted protein [Prunus dulcis]|uniref:Uncharacterized protein n=1 Tax=Prunus dulcis TaxID=3755 RepID=A0A5E4EQE7_PRUDU|nr:Hypothetical predicted protein [Prunus dulcis]
MDGWMHGNDACQVDRKKGDVRVKEAKCVTQIAMSGPKREEWLPFPAKGADVVPHQPFISRQRTHFLQVRLRTTACHAYSGRDKCIPFLGACLRDLSRTVTAHRLPFPVPKVAKTGQVDTPYAICKLKGRL